MSQDRKQSKEEKAGRYAAAGITALGTFFGVLAASAMGNQKLKRQIADGGVSAVHNITGIPQAKRPRAKATRKSKVSRRLPAIYSPITTTYTSAIPMPLVIDQTEEQ